MAALSFQWPTTSNRPGLNAGGHRQRLTPLGLPIPMRGGPRSKSRPPRGRQVGKAGPRLLALRGGGRDRDWSPPLHRSLFYECFCIITITMRPPTESYGARGRSTGEGREETGSVVRD